MSDGAFAETTLVKHEGALETPWRQMEKSKASLCRLFPLVEWNCGAEFV
jgi:hypothetical protein